MRERHQYPAVSCNVLSIPRLMHLLGSTRPEGLNTSYLSEILLVGGRYFQGDVNCGIESAQAQVLLPGPLETREGDLIVVTFAKSDMDLTHTIPRIRKVIKCEILFASSLPPEVSSETRGRSYQQAQQWSEFLFATREFFRDRGLLEVTTPTLVQNPGMEPELEPFSTEWRCGSRKLKLYLPTSPELHLKQLMVHGLTDIFEIKSVFRNEELTSYHEPEFSMLEWYRGFADLKIIETDLLAYLEFIEKRMLPPSERMLSPRERVLSPRERVLPPQDRLAVAGASAENRALFGEIQKYSVAEWIGRITQFTLTPTTSLDELFQLASRLGLNPRRELSWNDLFHLIWVAKVEPELPAQPFFLFDYPPTQAALARINPRGWADRFEFFCGGIEIANAFHELNDPVEQRRRFERDQKLRVEYGRTPLEIDENFMEALMCGLPPSGGIALGLDRLFMILTGAKKLAEFRPFSMNRLLQSSDDA